MFKNLIRTGTSLLAAISFTLALPERPRRRRRR